MAYVKQFVNPYPSGWVDLPNEDTPIDASALQAHTDAIEAIDNYLEQNPPDELKESLIQYEQSGFLSYNILNCQNLVAKTINGVTFTPVFERGALQYINVNGTATANTGYWFDNLIIPSGYKVVGCPNGGGLDGYCLYVGSKEVTQIVESGNGFVASTDLNTTNIGIRIANGTNCNNLKFKPMVCSDTSKTVADYTPYAMPNTDLTKVVEDIDASMKMLGWTLPSEFKGRNYIDSNGVFHQTIDRVDLGTLPWQSTTWGSSDAYYCYVLGEVPYKPTSDTVAPNFYTIPYRTYDRTTLQNNNYTGITGHWQGQYITVRDLSKPTLEAFKDSITGVYLYYELATEVTKRVDGNELGISLKESFSQLYADGFASRNLFNKANIENGHYLDANGVKTTGSNFSIAQFIEIKPNTRYNLNAKDFGGTLAESGRVRVHEYNSSKTWLRQLSATEASNKFLEQTFVTSADAKYIQFSYQTIASDYVQLELGNASHSYTPYAPSNTELKQSLNQLQTIEEIDFKSALTSLLGASGVKSMNYAKCLKKGGIAYVTIEFDINAGQIPNANIDNGVSTLGLPIPKIDVSIIGGWSNFGGALQMSPNGRLLVRINPSATVFNATVAYPY